MIQRLRLTECTFDGQFNAHRNVAIGDRPLHPASAMPVAMQQAQDRQYGSTLYGMRSLLNRGR